VESRGVWHHWFDCAPIFTTSLWLWLHEWKQTIITLALQTLIKLSNCNLRCYSKSSRWQNPTVSRKKPSSTWVAFLAGHGWWGNVSQQTAMYWGTRCYHNLQVLRTNINKDWSLTYLTIYCLYKVNFSHNNNNNNNNIYNNNKLAWFMPQAIPLLRISFKFALEYVNT